MFRTFAIPILAPAVLLVTITAAFAEFRVCNKSHINRIDVAIGHEDKESGWISEGWWAIQKGKCSTLLTVSLNDQSYIYVYAKGNKDDGELSTWWAYGNLNGAPFCLDHEHKFELRLDDYMNDNVLDCEAHGYTTIKFLEFGLKNQTDHTVDIK